MVPQNYEPPQTYNQILLRSQYQKPLYQWDPFCVNNVWTI